MKKQMMKKLVILDLDETLMYATSTPKTAAWDFELPPYKVYKRPFLEEFLTELKEHYRIAIWSSASDQYVEEMVAHIVPKNFPLCFVWGRSKCTLVRSFEEISDIDYTDHSLYLKNVKKVYRKGYASKESILIVDDTQSKLRRNYGNAIYPTAYRGNPADDELKKLLRYLIKIKDVSNFRSLEKRNWKSQL